MSGSDKEEVGKDTSDKPSKAGLAIQSSANSDVAKEMNLADLLTGMPGLTTASGEILSEAAAVCLEHKGHSPGAILTTAGLSSDEYSVRWLKVDDQIRNSHADLQEATERGACGLAILTVYKTTGLVVAERARKGTGHDYWLQMPEEDEDSELPFQNRDRLEVSGILSGTKSQRATRMRQKLDQMSPSDSCGNGYAAIVEFGAPIAEVQKK